MKHIFLKVLLLLFCLDASTQVYVEGGKTRHRFAQLNMGVDVRFYPGTSTRTSFFNATGEIENRKLTDTYQSCIVIGGTHFWGHADFFIAIPFLNGGKSGFKPYTETGARYFPKRIEDKKVRVFIGAGWMPSAYRQEKGAEKVKHDFPFSAGFVYNRKHILFEMSASYNFNNKSNYYITPEKQVSVTTPPLHFSIGVKWMIETTLSAEKDWQSGRTKLLTDTLSKLGRLNSFTLAAGISSARFLKESDHIRDIYPYLHQPELNKVFPEFGLGYYIHNPDLQINLSYRTVSYTQEAFGLRQSARRRALTLEAYHFFGDYHGFACFAGLGLSREWLSLEEKMMSNEEKIYKENLTKPAIVFGWDIRPNRLQALYLRTNLRWVPNLDLNTIQGKKFAFDQLEFNFIQCVILVDRLF